MKRLLCPALAFAALIADARSADPAPDRPVVLGMEQSLGLRLELIRDAVRTDDQGRVCWDLRSVLSNVTPDTWWVVDLTPLLATPWSGVVQPFPYPPPPSVHNAVWSGGGEAGGGTFVKEGNAFPVPNDSYMGVAGNQIGLAESFGEICLEPIRRGRRIYSIAPRKVLGPGEKIEYAYTYVRDGKAVKLDLTYACPPNRVFDDEAQWESAQKTIKEDPNYYKRGDFPKMPPEPPHGPPGKPCAPWVGMLYIQYEEAALPGVGASVPSATPPPATPPASKREVLGMEQSLGLRLELIRDAVRTDDQGRVCWDLRSVLSNVTPDTWWIVDLTPLRANAWEGVVLPSPYPPPESIHKGTWRDGGRQDKMQWGGGVLMKDVAEFPNANAQTVGVSGPWEDMARTFSQICMDGSKGLRVLNSRPRRVLAPGEKIEYAYTYVRDGKPVCLDLTYACPPNRVFEDDLRHQEKLRALVEDPTFYEPPFGRELPPPPLVLPPGRPCAAWIGMLYIRYTEPGSSDPPGPAPVAAKGELLGMEQSLGLRLELIRDAVRTNEHGNVSWEMRSVLTNTTTNMWWIVDVPPLTPLRDSDLDFFNERHPLGPRVRAWNQGLWGLSGQLGGGLVLVNEDGTLPQGADWNDSNPNIPWMPICYENRVGMLRSFNEVCTKPLRKKQRVLSCTPRVVLGPGERIEAACSALLRKGPVKLRLLYACPPNRLYADELRYRPDSPEHAAALKAYREEKKQYDELMANPEELERGSNNPFYPFDMPRDENGRPLPPNFPPELEPPPHGPPGKPCAAWVGMLYIQYEEAAAGKNSAAPAP